MTTASLWFLYFFVAGVTAITQFQDRRRPWRTSVVMGLIWPLALAVYLFKGLMDCFEIAFGDVA